MAELEAADAGPVPTAFVAFTVNVYAVPLVNPVTVIGLAGPVAVLAPGLEVTVYDLIALPPSDDGAVKLTSARAFPGFTLPIVGAPGDVGDVNATELVALPKKLPVPDTTSLIASYPTVTE